MLHLVLTLTALAGSALANDERQLLNHRRRRLGWFAGHWVECRPHACRNPDAGIPHCANQDSYPAYSDVDSCTSKDNGCDVGTPSCSSCNSFCGGSWSEHSRWVSKSCQVLGVGPEEDNVKCTKPRSCPSVRKGTCSKCSTGYWLASPSKCEDCATINGVYCANGVDKTALGSCPAGQYRDDQTRSTPGTCKSCPAGTIKAGTGSWSTLCTVCPEGKYANAAGTGCTDCPPGFSCNGGQSTVCAPGTYSEGTKNTGCLACPAGFKCFEGAKTACPAGTFQPSGGSSTCTDCLACGTGETRTNCESASAGYCKGGACLPCEPGYVNEGCNTEENADLKGECKLCKQPHECTAPNTYLKDPCVGNKINNAQCVACETCPAGQFRDGCGLANAGTCRNVKSCYAGATRETEPPTDFTDRVCEACTPCGTGTYRSYTCNGNSTDSVCKPITNCGFVAATASTRASGKWEKSEETATSDRICEDLHECNWDTEYHLKSTPSAYQDYWCEKLTNCNPLEFVEVEPTETEDRECKQKTPCRIVDGKYTLDDGAALNSPTDRTCGEISPICTEQPGKMFQEIGPTTYADRICRNCSDTFLLINYRNKTINTTNPETGRWEIRLNDEARESVANFESTCLPKILINEDFCYKGGDSVGLSEAAFCGIFGSVVGLAFVAGVSTFYVRNKRNAAKKRALRGLVAEKDEMMNVEMTMDVNPMIVAGMEGGGRSEHDAAREKALMEENRRLKEQMQKSQVGADSARAGAGAHKSKPRKKVKKDFAGDRV